MNGAEQALALSQRITRICSQTLNLASMVLHGSLVLDDYVPGSSDIDLLAVTDRALSDREVESLTRAVAATRNQPPAPLDLRVITSTTAAAPEPLPPIELYVRFDRLERIVIEARHARDRDLAIELSLCRQHGRALFGAEPTATIGKVADEWVLAACDAQLADWQSLTDDDPHAALMVLTACRAWRFSADSTHCSKTATGRWALERDGSLTAVRDALRQRAGEAVAIEAEEVGRVLSGARAGIADARNV